MTGGVGHVTLWYIQGESLLPSKTVVDYDVRGILADPLGRAWMNNNAGDNNEGDNNEGDNEGDRPTHRRHEDHGDGGGENEEEWGEEEDGLMDGPMKYVVI